MFKSLGVVAVLMNSTFAVLLAAQTASGPTNNPSGLRIATFDIDATPPIGTMMAYDPVTNRWDLGLRARGIVLLGAGEPIVLCALDWIGLANEGYDSFRSALARGANTSPRRTAIHTLHQHDAPDCDFSAERILRTAGVGARQYEGQFQRLVLTNLEAAVRESLSRSQPVRELGLGAAKVERVASNRRIIGGDGKVRATRWSATLDPLTRAEPEGLIDATVSLVSFWNGEQPVAVLSYYATHPQSYYRTGIANPDFPGVARFLRQLALPGALHVHFTGAGGNITAGKYNDGAPTNRLALAERLADGMRRAWEQTVRQPISSSAVDWSVASVALPPTKHLALEELAAQLKTDPEKFAAEGKASRLAWLQRCQAGHRVDVTCLNLGPASILHLPGEPFIEYQLAAKAARRDRFIAVAGYGDYAPWYIGTAAAYEQGGYETSPTASNVAPEVEKVLLDAMRRLLGVAK